MTSIYSAAEVHRFSSIPSLEFAHLLSGVSSHQIVLIIQLHTLYRLHTAGMSKWMQCKGGYVQRREASCLN